MAFKSLTTYNAEKFRNFFVLRNDGEFADVIFMYRNVEDVLVADVHYIKSAEYTGYVHCCGVGCPACAKNIRVQTKLFIPVYNIQAKEIQFFDRNTTFENQLNQDVFSKFPNPCDYVFRITRHGAYRDVNTTYNITAVGRNTSMSYDSILQSLNVQLPDYYKTVCMEYSSAELDSMLNSASSSSVSSEYASSMPSYSVTPRGVLPDKEEPNVSVPDYVDDIPDFEESSDDEIDF